MHELTPEARIFTLPLVNGHALGANLMVEAWLRRVAPAESEAPPTLDVQTSMEPTAPPMDSPTSVGPSCLQPSAPPMETQVSQEQALRQTPMLPEATLDLGNPALLMMPWHQQLMVLAGRTATAPDGPTSTYLSALSFVLYGYNTVQGDYDPDQVFAGEALQPATRAFANRLLPAAEHFLGLVIHELASVGSPTSGRLDVSQPMSSTMLRTRKDLTQALVAWVRMCAGGLLVHGPAVALAGASGDSIGPVFWESIQAWSFEGQGVRVAARGA